MSYSERALTNRGNAVKTILYAEMKFASKMVKPLKPFVNAK